MIESVAGDLAPKRAETLRDRMCQLKQVFATADALKRPPIAAAALLGVVARSSWLAR